MKRVETIVRPEQVEFFLRLLGLWEGVIDIPPPHEAALRHRDLPAHSRRPVRPSEQRIHLKAQGSPAR